jgi:large subunit ribosomal protein L24
MNIKKGDTVVVLSGKDKGKTGKVMGRRFPRNSKVIVEGVNIACHIKPRSRAKRAASSRSETPIYASKVQLVCPKCGKGTRVAHKIENGKKSASASTAARRCKKGE